MSRPLPTSEALPEPSSFDAFLNSLHEPGRAGPALSPRRFADVLGMDLQTLAELAGVHRNTLSRAPASPGVEDLLRYVLSLEAGPAG